MKGARYKTKRVLMETIHKRKAELIRGKDLENQANLAKSKAAGRKEKKSAVAATA